MQTPAALGEKFRAVVRERRSDYVAQAESILTDIARIKDAKAVPALLGLFDDTVEHDELMFSIIHIVEQWDDETYCRELIGAAEQLWRRSPRWAQIVHLRILNSEKTLNVYLSSLARVGEAQRRPVRDIYTAIAQRWPKLSTKAQEVVDRLGLP